MRLHKFSNFNKGMTFIELIVVIGIFAAMTGIILFNFSGFNTNITLQNLANQIALQIKSAQTDAITGKASYFFTGFCGVDPNTGINLSCKPSYGVYFKVSDHSKFKYFADKNNDKQLIDTLCNSTGVGTECLSEVEINTSDIINKICLDTSNCSTSLPLNITFKRPFPDANFDLAGIGGSNAEIEIKSAKNICKTIKVGSTGQIEIKNGPISGTCQ